MDGWIDGQTAFKSHVLDFYDMDMPKNFVNKVLHARNVDTYMYIHKYVQGEGKIFSLLGLHAFLETMIKWYMLYKVNIFRKEYYVLKYSVLVHRTFRKVT